MKKSFILFILMTCVAASVSLAQLTPQQHTKLVSVARWLSKFQIGYGSDWVPPGENSTWTMDCSNTARFLYRTALDKDIPRTASDQYLDLKEKKILYKAPVTEDGDIDTKKLLDRLRSGDLLFWEWTYNIKRYPPISHVMIYLGKTKEGAPKMVGSSSRDNRGGVHVYDFDPNAPSGGVKSFFGDYVHKGRFVAYGRPLSEPKNDAIASTKKPQTVANE